MIQLWTLGSLDLRGDDGREMRPILSQPKRLALLAYLALPGSRTFHRRDELLGVFWPEVDQERARAALNRAIYYLRNTLGGAAIVSRGDDEIALAPDSVWCDAAAFHDAIDAGDHPRALELYRGDFLTGFFVSDLPGLEQWLEGERAHLRAHAARAALALAETADARGDLATAAARAEQAFKFAPYDEAVFRRYLSLLDRTGDRAGAVVAYEEFTRRVVSELDVTPSPETQALVEAIRARTQAFAEGAVERVPTVADSGAHTAAAVAAPSNAPKARQARSLPMSRLIIPAGGIALALAASAMLMRPTPSLERDRVVVAAFANRTGNAALEPLGALAADLITQSLVQTGLVPNVAQPVTPRAMRIDGGDDVAEIETLGKRAHAAIVVAGAFYRDGDSLRFNARIVDLLRGNVVWAVQPIVATTDSARHAIELTAQHATGAVAALMDPRFASWFPIATAPPTFAAFQEFARGVDLHVRSDPIAALKHYLRAIALDTAFTWARLEAAMAHLNSFENAAADSIADAISPVRDRVTPLLGHLLDWMDAMRAEDYVRAYWAMQRAAALAPERFLFSLAQSATKINRPTESLEALERLGPKSPYNGGSPRYWEIVTKSLHQLGQHRRELQAARQARRDHPESVYALGYEIRALAALGQIDTLRSRLEDVFAYAREDSRDVRLWEHKGITLVLINAAEELRAHGHPRVAARALEQTIAWHRSRPAAEARTKERRGELGRALYAAAQWDEAEIVFRALDREYPGDVPNTGFLGAIAAHRSDRVRAEQCLALLEAMKRKAARRDMQTSFWQAHIAALLGDREGAVRHLVDLLGEQGRYMHPNSDFESLRGYRPFEELFRPKG
jgi:DNA-binding SARP family transcriptional activator/TolB-like protein